MYTIHAIKVYFYKFNAESLSLIYPIKILNKMAETKLHC